MYQEREALETIEYKGYAIHLYTDENAGDCGPREWDNLGTMRCLHSRYALGDQNLDKWVSRGEEGKPSYREYDLTDGADFRDWIEDSEAAGELVSLALYLYEHGGITMSCHRTGQYADRWDAGQVGYIYATRETILKEYGGKRLTKKLKDRALRYMEGEVQTYDDYLTGNVRGYEIETIDETRPSLTDSCWNFYPESDKGYSKEWDYLIEECKEIIDATLEREYSQLRLPIAA